MSQASPTPPPCTCEIRCAGTSGEYRALSETCPRHADPVEQPAPADPGPWFEPVDPDDRTRLAALTDRCRRSFDRAQVDTRAQLAAPGDFGQLALWLLGALQSEQDRDQRHAYLDGALAVLDDLDES